MRRLLLSFLLAASALAAHAQFTTAIAPDIPFPSAPKVLRPDDIHCYTANVAIAGAGYDLYVYGWNSAGTVGEGIAWRLMSGGALVSSGVVPIPNSSSIDLGVVQDPSTGAPKVIVGYHLTGTGHFLDIYDVSTGGLTLSSSTPLSSSSFPRIAVDAHKLYGVLVTWVDPASGIQVMTLNTNSGSLVWGPQYTLDATYKCSDPDITFTHDNATGILNGHVVFHRNSPDQLEEQSMDFFAMQYGGGGIYTGVPEDIYPIPPGMAVGKASIDAPEHGTVENWAFAFAQTTATTGTGPILARVRDVVGGTVNMYDATEGPYGSGPGGPFDFSPFMNGGPCLAYDNDENFFRVAWFNSKNPFSAGKYLIQKMDIGGGFANPGGTYLDAEISPSNNVSGTRCITLTPNNAFPRDFCAFGYYDNINNYSIKVKDIPWSLSSFKTALQATQLATSVISDFDLYPNPSVLIPTLSFKGELGDAEMTAAVLDNGGRILATVHGTGQGISTAILERWNMLSAGTYNIRIDAPSLGFSKTKQFEKL